PSVMGAGLGNLDLSPGPCLITASGIHENAALVLSLPAPMAFGLHHGFNNVAGPFLVTESDGNVIHSINYQSAFSFYKEVLEQQLGHAIELNDFADVAKNYPFGMLQLDNEFLVRDPLQWQDDSITCAGCIPENTTVYILHSTADGLINAAAEAAKDLNADLLPAYGDHQGYFSFLIDCISRIGFLGERYGDELQAITDNLPDGTPLIGILTLGEIASSRQGSIHFLNKTTVVGGVKR
ncbi:MAG: FIST C-terminal domain-containing protein, partial [Motiliproteus sp.]|nr:FIST C-terminal domain-containing protein [Motiliproteus sp.]